MIYTREQLQDVVRERLSDLKLVVVANREPYIHTYEGDEIVCKLPAGGLTTALDPVMRATGGVWVAHGSGDADRAVVDENDRVAVPPGRPSYSLRRIWLTKAEEQGYYFGFANQGLWPLCHIAFTRPKFDQSDWEYYRQVNERFAEAVIEELDGDGPALVFIHDYHFALLPRMLKEARPDVVLAHFWHTPWPNHEAFRVCPWQEQILDGLLGNDLLSFHIQYDCNNFFDSVARAIEARIDMETHAVTCNGHDTLVRPYPISIAPDQVEASLPDDIDAADARFRKRYRLGSARLIAGIDRVDYTKGIPERFAAVDRLLAHHPELLGKVTMVQIGAPSRERIPIYRQLNEHLRALAEDINWRHGNSSWRPIVFLNEQHGADDVRLLCRIADVCVVSSLHDGMNLVAKEFVASRTDERGVLILSQFTGAARELTEAIPINPYAIDDFAESLHRALAMPEEEQRQRMRRMRAQVEENNIYHWAGSLLCEAGKVAESLQLPAWEEPSLTKVS